ncbi:MAG: AIR synthase-related protein [Thermoleophilaceae bacterium]|jgi:phosphoribosylformylglycinamidine cyclo-ligase
MRNLLRLEAAVGYRIDAPLPVPAVFELIAARGATQPAEMQEVFNMGCGFVCVVPEADASAAAELLAARHPGTAVIGATTDRAGTVELAAERLVGTEGAGFSGA